MPTLSLRPAFAADTPLILSFIRGLAAYERLTHECEATEEQLLATLFPEASAPAAHVIIGEIDGVASGFALYFFNYSTFLARPGLYLEDLFVLPERRGSGLGKALLLRLASIARERNCGRMEWSVIDWNEPAIGFYKKLGARPLSDWTIFRLDGEALRTAGSASLSRSLGRSGWRVCCR